MKKILPILLLLPFLAQSQKSVDRDKYRFQVQYRSLPAMKIDSTYRTYNVSIEGTQLSDHLMRDLNPENSVLLEGWKKLPQDGHLSIKVRMGDIVPGAVTIREKIYTSKTKNGQTVTKKVYYQEVLYTFDAKAMINDYKGAHIMDQELASRNNRQIYQSPEFPIRSLAEGYFVINSIAITKELYRNCVNRALHYLNERINYNFGFQAVTANDHMWIIDSRKHPEYKNHRQTFLTINEVLFSLTAHEPSPLAREHLQPAIDYFNKIKRQYTSTSKHDRKIRYASYYNLAVIYYYLDDPQAMMKEAKGLELNDFDPNDSKGFVKSATWLKTLFDQNNIYTRHFTIDTSQFRGPLENAELTKK